jgi:hypothetical protein
LICVNHKHHKNQRLFYATAGGYVIYNADQYRPNQYSYDMRLRRMGFGTQIFMMVMIYYD